MDKKEIINLIKTNEGYNLEFKRSFSNSIGKEICAFANASGGKIIIGVSDNGDIIGCVLSNDLKSKIQDLARNMEPKPHIEIYEIDNIVIISVFEGKDKPYSINGSFFIRIGANSQKLNRDEVKEFFQTEGGILFDEKFINFDFNDFSEKAYEDFLFRANINNNLEREQLLTNLGFLRNTKMNYSGILFFSSNIVKYLPNATIQCVLYQGKTRDKILDKKEFNSDLLLNYESVLKYIHSKLNTEYLILDAGPRKEVLELPEKAIREAVINAIAHRDYYSSSPILINIYQDKLEIINPAVIDSSITIEDLYNGTFPRNLFLFGKLEKVNLVEKVGSGFIRIKEEMKKYKLRNPQISFSRKIFIVIFKRPDMDNNNYQKRVLNIKVGIPKGSPKSSLKGSPKSSPKTEDKIVALIENNQDVTIEMMAKNLKISKRAVLKQINKLKKNNLLKRIGSPRNGYWVVFKK